MKKIDLYKGKGASTSARKGNILFMIMKYPKIYLGIT